MTDISVSILAKWRTEEHFLFALKIVKSQREKNGQILPLCDFFFKFFLFFFYLYCFFIVFLLFLLLLLLLYPVHFCQYVFVLISFWFFFLSPSHNFLIISLLFSLPRLSILFCSTSHSASPISHFIPSLLSIFCILFSIPHLISSSHPSSLQFTSLSHFTSHVSFPPFHLPPVTS